MAIIELERQRDPAHDPPFNRNDEISTYQLGRYICSNEAFWKTFRFPIHGRHPAVVKLHVHLENGQRVYFRQDNARRIAANPPRTTLTAFFELCQVDEFARTLLYMQVPSFYTWNISSRKFVRRLRGCRVDGDDIREADTIGRMFTVHPSARECFHLRLLLTVVRGPTSFQYLRTVNGVEYDTYQEACLALGLLEDDNQWEATLREAAETRMPSLLRELFCVIVCENNPANPRLLWETFRNEMSEDILNRVQRENPDLIIDYNDAIYNEALIRIEDDCYRRGKSLHDLHLPSTNRLHVDLLQAEILNETCYDRNNLEIFVEQHRPHLNAEQELAFNAIVDAVENDRGGLFFLDAPGGTGKTFLLNLILARLRRDGIIAVAAAASGIAATMLPNGRTAHSAFNIPIRELDPENPSCKIKRGTSKANLFRRCRAIIWDECTMSHKHHFEGLDNTLRDIRDKDELFGGLVVLLSGDFRQTLPVVPGGTPVDELDACIKKSRLWRHVQKYGLHMNMRVQLNRNRTSEEFAQSLLKIGDGTYHFHPWTGLLKFQPNFCHLAQSEEDLINKVFPNLERNLGNLDWLQGRAILCPLNEDVDQVNFIIQSKLPESNSRTYVSIDTHIDRNAAADYPIEFLNTLNQPNFPQHRIYLKVGMPIILNLNP